MCGNVQNDIWYSNQFKMRENTVRWKCRKSTWQLHQRYTVLLPYYPVSDSMRNKRKISDDCIGKIYNPRHGERWEVGEFKIFRVTGSAEAEQKGAMIRDLLHEILSAYTVGREPSRASFWGGGNSGGELSIDQVFWVLLENSTRDVNKNCLTRQKRLFLQIFILKFIFLGPLFFIPHKCGSGMETLTTEQNGIVPPQLKISTFHQRQK